MKLAYAPSGKRIIPYPPVGIAILAASLGQNRPDENVEVFDLEIELADRKAKGESILLYETGLSVRDSLAQELTDQVRAYGECLWTTIAGHSKAIIGISVMGFAQVASALLLGRIALEYGAKIIFGGQFFTETSAAELLHALVGFGEVTVTVGDGWDAIVAFAGQCASADLPNSYTAEHGCIVSGPRVAAKVLPPQPVYDWVPWPKYESFGSDAYKHSRPVRRAHLYVWDKQCNYRCAFCRVASGSRAVLTPPELAAQSFSSLVGEGVTQLNFMTNELNPSRKYMLRFLDAIEARNIATADWFSYVRADRLELVDFDRMRSLGGRLARFGVETGSQRLLDLMRKDYHVPTMERTLAAASRAEIWNHVNFLVGFPGEQADDIDQTVSFIARNADAIHSARINPFYLPPSTPIAQDPDQFDVRLTAFDRGWWQYTYSDGSVPDDNEVVRRVERISAACVENGVGFAGTDPFFLLDVLSRSDLRSNAVEFLKNQYPLFWIPAPTDVYKAMIGGYETQSNWKATALKRQQNYSLSICTD